MNGNGTRVKIFYVKNRSTSKNNRPFSQESSDNLSTFKNQYLSKNRSRMKDLTHLSTLLQRDKVNDFQEQTEIEQHKYKASKSLGIQQTYKKNDQFITRFSNHQLNRNLYTQFSQTHNDLSKIKGVVNLINYPQSPPKNFNQPEQKFFALTLQRKFFRPNNLSSMFKQKWCEHKLRKGQQKISNALKTTLNFNSHIFSQRQKARLKQKQLFKQSKNYSQKQTKRKTKQNFLHFIEEKKTSLSQPKVKENKSQKLIIQGKIVYQPSQRDLQKCYNRKKSMTQVKNYNKTKHFSSKLKNILDSQVLEKSNRNGESFNQRIFQNKNLSNKMIEKKKKSIFLSRQDQQKLWWSKQDIVEKTGCDFDLKKTLIL